jgi:hypothetical protein
MEIFSILKIFNDLLPGRIVEPKRQEVAED